MNKLSELLGAKFCCRHLVCVVQEMLGSVDYFYGASITPSHLKRFQNLSS